MDEETYKKYEKEAPLERMGQNVEQDVGNLLGIAENALSRKLASWEEALEKKFPHP